MHKNGEIYGARFCLSDSRLFQGLPGPPDADFSLSYSRGSLAEWKQRLFIGERGQVIFSLIDFQFTYKLHFSGLGGAVSAGDRVVHFTCARAV